MNKWWMILASQIWHLPFLALYILGLVFALTRRDMGKASRFAAIAFSLMILGSIIGTANMYYIYSMREDGAFDPARYMRMSSAIAFATMIVNLGGWCMALA